MFSRVNDQFCSSNPLCCAQHYAPYAPTLYLLSPSTPWVKILERQFVQPIKGWWIGFRPADWCEWRVFAHKLTAPTPRMPLQVGEQLWLLVGACLIHTYSNSLTWSRAHGCVHNRGTIEKLALYQLASIQCCIQSCAVIVLFFKETKDSLISSMWYWMTGSQRNMSTDVKLVSLANMISYIN